MIIAMHYENAFESRRDDIKNFTPSGLCGDGDWFSIIITHLRCFADINTDIIAQFFGIKSKSVQLFMSAYKKGRGMLDV